MRIGFLAAGGMARFHMKKLAAIPEAQVVAVCDIVREKADAAAAASNAQVFTDFSSMIDKADLEALWICLPPYAHDGQELEAAKRRIPMFVEKPVALEPDYMQKVSKAIRAANIVVSVGYQYRYSDMLEFARRRIEDKKVSMFISRYLCPLPQTPWWRVKAQSGGQLTEQVTHHLDIARYLGGEVETVAAMGSGETLKDVPNFDAEDTSVVLLKFRNGAIGTVSATCVLSKGWNSEVEIIAGGARVQLLLAPAGKVVVTNGGEETFTTATDPYLLEDQAFLDAVRSGERSGIRCDYDEALKTLAISLAADRSMAAGGQPVPV